jgi:hypothetical protein
MVSRWQHGSNSSRSWVSFSIGSFRPEAHCICLDGRLCHARFHDLDCPTKRCMLIAGRFAPGFPCGDVDINASASMAGRSELLVLTMRRIRENPCQPMNKDPAPDHRGKVLNREAEANLEQEDRRVVACSRSKRRLAAPSVLRQREHHRMHTQCNDQHGEQNRHQPGGRIQDQPDFPIVFRILRARDRLFGHG